ncbi:hypothetical protein SteCoe_27720 [Stentor coeruleus]|uniref:Tubulin--tyrosine ligase-like protein 5 n=1 Tax=Stentor coeruleus TaxID=5963 RepID=A0A1R2B9W7_9CILI|nr:hypothetical protein SteCoe_27720 [Stentor coeruleus]
MNYNRKNPLITPELTVTKLGSSLAKSSSKPNYLNLSLIGRPGQGLHSSIQTPEQQTLHTYYSNLSSRLTDSDIYKPPLITLTQLSPNQQLKDPNPHTKSMSSSTQLLYKTIKAEAKLVRSILENSGFIHTDSHTWNLLWSGIALQEYIYEDLNSNQKINHFPYSNELTRKDKLCLNITAMQEKYGKEHFNFIPETYILPDGLSKIYNKLNYDKKSIWIVKPACSSQGKGIFLVDSILDVPIDNICVISKYIENPYLINGLKFDIRLYVLVTSFEPLRIYLYEEGLTRFASEKYANDLRENRYVHLTNYSVNKKNENYIQNISEKEDGVGHKWSLTALMKYFKEKGVDTDDLWMMIYDMIVKSVLSIEGHVMEASKRLGLHRGNCFDLFGFDVILDSKLKPWLLEVNLSPSMATESPLDFFIKSNLLTDTFNLIGIRMKAPRKASGYKTCSKLTISKLKNSPYLVQRPAKNKLSGKKIQEILRETLSEYSRKGGFLRLYPCKNADFYDQFFSQIKPINKIINSILFNNNQDLNHLEGPLQLKPMPISTNSLKSTSFDGSNDTKTLQFIQENKGTFNTEELLIEYLQRIIKLLKDINEKHLPNDIKFILENFSSHFSWKTQENIEVSLVKKLENRIQEMKCRKKNVKSIQKFKNFVRSTKNNPLHEYSDEEINDMLENLNKKDSLDVICALFEGNGVLNMLKGIKAKNSCYDKQRNQIFVSEQRNRSLPKRPNTSVRLKFVF